MNADQVKAALEAVLAALKEAEALLPNVAVLPKLEAEVNHLLASPFALQALAWGFGSAADLVFFLLNHFGIPTSLVKDALAKVGVRL